MKSCAPCSESASADLTKTSAKKEIEMIRNPRTRRVVSIVLMALGGLLIFLAPEDFWMGAVLFVLGVGLEAIGMRVQRRTGS